LFLNSNHHPSFFQKKAEIWWFANLEGTGLRSWKLLFIIFLLFFAKNSVGADDKCKYYVIMNSTDPTQITYEIKKSEEMSKQDLADYAKSQEVITNAGAAANSPTSSTRATRSATNAIGKPQSNISMPSAANSAPITANMTEEQKCKQAGGYWSQGTCTGSNGTAWTSKWNAKNGAFDCVIYDFIKKEKDWQNKPEYMFTWSAADKKCVSVAEKNCANAGNTWHIQNYACLSHKDDENNCKQAGGKYSKDSAGNGNCVCNHRNISAEWSSSGSGVCKCTVRGSGKTTSINPFGSYLNFAEICIETWRSAKCFNSNTKLQCD
jgi:hypothetical protein